MTFLRAGFAVEGSALLFLLGKERAAALPRSLGGAVSSAGRAPGLHPGGRQFETVTAHHVRNADSDPLPRWTRCSARFQTAGADKARAEIAPCLTRYRLATSAKRYSDVREAAVRSFCFSSVWKDDPHAEIVLQSEHHCAMQNLNRGSSKNSPGSSEKPGLFGLGSNRARLFNVTTITVS